MDAAYEAANAFFLLHRLLPSEAKVWFTSSNVLIPRWRQKILSALAACDMLTDNLMTAYTAGFMKDSSYVPAMGDVIRMVKILRLRGEQTDVAKSQASMPNAFS